MSTPAAPPAAAPAYRAARRPSVLFQGFGAAVGCAALAGLAYLGQWPLAAGVLVVQLLLILAFLALVDAPAAGGGFLVAALGAVAADVVVLVTHGKISGLAGVIGLGLVAALLHQLLRRGRARVTESLSDTLVALVLAVAVVPLVALRIDASGRETVLICLAAGGAALLLGRLGDRVVRRPALAVGASRGWPGLVLGIGAGAAAAVGAAGRSGNVPGARAALLGIAVAAAVAAADLAVDLGAAELTGNRRDARRVSALAPVSLLLPLAALAPVAFVAGRLVLA